MHEGEHRSDQNECEDTERSEEVTFDERALKAREAKEGTKARVLRGRSIRGWPTIQLHEFVHITPSRYLSDISRHKAVLTSTAQDAHV